MAEIAGCGVDAIGLNFFPKSKRYVLPEIAAEIRAEMDDQRAVGLFVNPELAQVDAVLNRVPLDLLQFHGDEPPEFLRQAAQFGVPIVKAVRCPGSSFETVKAAVTEYLDQGGNLAAVLLDAYSESGYGGTGETMPWEWIRRRPAWLKEVPLILAGGLTPENVAVAVAAAAPDGVDTASGVESSPGTKSSERSAQFVHEARAALDC